MWGVCNSRAFPAKRVLNKAEVEKKEPMKLQTALHRLLSDPTQEIRRLDWPDKRASLVIRANVKELAPSRDDIRWDSVLYEKRGKASKAAKLTVYDYLTHDWTVRKTK